MCRRDSHKDVMKNVMMPAMARGAHVKVEKRTEALRRWAETASINTVEYNDKRIGIICAGTTYTYAKEALGERASFLKLGMVNPLPVSLIVEFARNVGPVSYTHLSSSSNGSFFSNITESPLSSLSAGKSVRVRLAAVCPCG